MEQEKINELVNKIVDIIVKRDDNMKEWGMDEETKEPGLIKTYKYVIDLEDRFCFWKANTKQLYTNIPVKHKHNSLANESLQSERVYNYTIGAKIENGVTNYVMFGKRGVKELQELYDEITTRY